MRLVLYQPDIPQNAGTLLRLAACLGVGADIVEPCGFVLSDRHFRPAGMDYLAQAQWVRHRSWAAYCEGGPTGRLVALTPTGEVRHVDYSFRPDDRLLLGEESTGLPADVEAGAHARVRVPMRAGLRSLNVAVAAAMVLGEALRQTGLYPPSPPDTERP
jgi:tRNA (cytidine/uridine-2'-O-)-methyltransferase